MGSETDPIVVMVDGIQVSRPSLEDPLGVGPALYGSSMQHIAALHDFAKKIGLKRAWFQDHKLVPHYDLTPGRHSQALAHGAVLVSAIDQARDRVARRKSELEE